MADIRSPLAACWRASSRSRPARAESPLEPMTMSSALGDELELKARPPGLGETGGLLDRDSRRGDRRRIRVRSGSPERPTGDGRVRPSQWWPSPCPAARPPPGAADRPRHPHPPRSAPVRCTPRSRRARAGYLGTNHFSALPSDFASLPRSSASLQNDLASLLRSSASLQNGLASLLRSSASLRNDFASLLWSSAGLQNDLAIRAHGWSGRSNSNPAPPTGLALVTPLIMGGTLAALLDFCYLFGWQGRLSLDKPKILGHTGRSGGCVPWSPPIHHASPTQKDT